MSACSPLQPKSWGSVLGDRHGPTRLVAARSPRSKDTKGRHRGGTRAAPPRPQPSSALRLLLHGHPRSATAGCTTFPAPCARIQIKGGFVRVQSAKITWVTHCFPRAEKGSGSSPPTDRERGDFCKYLHSPGEDGSGAGRGRGGSSPEEGEAGGGPQDWGRRLGHCGATQLSARHRAWEPPLLLGGRWPRGGNLPNRSTGAGSGLNAQSHPQGAD